MKRILLLFATREGQTEKIARVITDHLEEAVANPALVDIAEVDKTELAPLTDFDLLVFGASLHEGRIEKSMQQFINTHAKVISGIPHSFFLVSLSAAEKNAVQRKSWLEEAGEKVQSSLGVHFDHMEMIAGALRYSKYSWLEKFFMKRIVGKAGGDTDTSRDYEYTDWQQVYDYARSLAN
jgi:menaquinone-dependent protoporphyrinogen oxidase